MRTCQEEIISWGQKPCNYQLPFFSLLSRKSFSNFVLLTDENFHSLFLISFSFNYCLSTMLLTQLSATLSAKSFKMQWHAGKTMSANNELITATSFFSQIQSIFSWVSLSISAWKMHLTAESPLHPSILLFIPAWVDDVQHLYFFGEVYCSCLLKQRLS